MNIVPRDRSLAHKAPHLVSEWSPKNPNTPWEVYQYSNKKAEWVCADGHEWLSVIGARTRGSGCPHCSGRAATPGKSDLGTINPELASQWSSKNNKKVSEIRAKSSYKAWWVCGLGHEWRTSVANRSAGKGCPVCCGQVTVKDFNDLATAYPELAAQWSNKNSKRATEVAPYSNKKFWWVCSLGHEWQAAPNNRASKNQGCSICNNTTILPGFNDLATRNPELAAQWSNRNSESSDQVSPNSGYRAWWVCADGHEWCASINNRAQGTGCPICSGKSIQPGYNDLATTDSALALQWSSKNKKSVTEISAGSDYYAWWVCSLGHEWQAVVYSRVKNECPVCANKKVLPGYNDLATVRPDIAAQWSSKNDKKPSEVSPHNGYKAWWVCGLGHEWKTSVGHRTSKNSPRKCPNCAKIISSQEEVITSTLRAKNLSVVTSSRQIIKPYELDIYLPDHNLAIEFNGVYWHTEERGKDAKYHQTKHQMCTDKGIQLLMVWEDDWLSKQEIVKRLILRKIGASDEAKVPARKTKVVLVTKKEAAPFLNDNHIQGFVAGSYYVSLQIDGKIVALSVLKRTGQTLLLSRYATNCIVQGGHSKIISWVQKNLDFEKIVTFADLEISDGSLYEKTGWTREETLRPDYKYVVNGRRVHKFNYRLKRFREDPDLIWEDGLSESQLAALNGLPRVWDCGKIRYTMPKKPSP